MNSVRGLTISTKLIASVIVAFILVRLGLLALFNGLVGGRELASDVVFHAMIIADPLATLNGTAKEIASYPPFQWLVEWPLFNMYASFFSDLISFRLLMVTVEFVCLLVFLRILTIRYVDPKVAATVLLFFVISPHQLFATVFFVQEDVIAQCFVLFAMMFIFSNKRLASIITLTLGVLIAKLFLIIPLFYVIAYWGRSNFLRRLLEGAAVCAVLAGVYILIIYNAFQNGGDVPLLEFTPDGVYASNYWVLLLNHYPESLEAIKSASLKLSLVAQLFLVGVGLYLLIQSKNQNVDPVYWVALPLAIFFATFYQHMPEYLLLIWPALIFLYRSVVAQFLIVVCMNMAWLPRIFHGLGSVGSTEITTADARTDLIAPLVEALGINPQYFNVGFLVLHSVGYTLLVISLIGLFVKHVKAQNEPVA